MKFKVLYVITEKPANRQEKRIAQKEYDKINRVILPFLYSYAEAREEDWQRYNKIYKEECRIVNVKNRFVHANPMAFELNTMSIQQIEFNDAYEKRKKWIAIFILANIILFFILLFVL